MKTIKINTLEETNALGLKLGSLIDEQTLITLTGDLGAGKTTFTKAIGKGLGITKTINSPTFTILKSYYGRMPLHHIDAYRLEGISQDLGFEEVFEDEACCIVEWPNFIEEMLPEERLEIQILRINDDEREFIFQPIGDKYEKLLEDLV